MHIVFTKLEVVLSNCVRFFLCGIPCDKILGPPLNSVVSTATVRAPPLRPPSLNLHYVGVCRFASSSANLVRWAL